MIITNRSKAPQSVVNLVTFAGYEAKGDISVTRLIKPPRIVALFSRYKDTIEMDVQDLAWSVLGQAVHVLLERATGGDVIVEKRLHAKILGWDVNGQPDAYHIKKKRIEDYKVTSVWSFILTQKFEWEAQLNLNAMLHRLHGQEVEEVAIVAFLRDWQRAKAEYDLKYPQMPIHVIGVPLWDQKKCVEYAEERVNEHQVAAELEDSELPLCTPQERWYRNGGWPVMKNGNKKADRVFDTEGEAQKFMAVQTPSLKKGRYFLPLKERPGENIRCVHYCEARSVCPFAAQLRADAAKDQSDAQNDLDL